MIATLKAKSQVTIPASIVKEAGLQTGDAFDATYKNGSIVLTSMVYIAREDAAALGFAQKMDARYESMLEGNFVQHDLIEE